MNIIFFVFGTNISYYQQVFFSIYTVLANKDETDDIIVIAEDPTLFKQLGDRVKVIPIDTKMISDWKGDYDYFFRVKIKALEYISQEYPDKHILYLDGDTFVYQPLSIIKAGLAKGHNFLHLNEGTLPTLKTKTEKKLWEQIKYKKFADILIDENTTMWNSGVIGISTQNFATIPLALQITDEMCAAKVTCFTMEQLSFGIASNQLSTVKAADHIVGHYWGNKDQWNSLISIWISKSLMTNLTEEEMIESARKFPFVEIPFYVKTSNTYKRLSKRLQSVFKTKNACYINS
ncbi:hypothetical protein [Flavobacterium sp. HSC-61S13]|uniref:hypothetical protein n=1 Tax=Flavobacterium sp. HSC-61S13 TaxID=2910963 RepID=UPI00209EB52B|nr:hypothetical protein [Flavobacterium sp. HSC-61S13]MCP1997380.1 hypothetical protein [Flavobacterium sp. HSC-61S13]